jgi:hypothetical protein
MADGFKVEFEGEDAARVEAAARQQGVSADAYVRDLVLSVTQDEAGLEADRREISRRWALFEASGQSYDHSDVAAVLKRRAGGEPLP